MSSLIPIERRKRILDILVREQSARVNDLSDALGVSEVTIRRDLEMLENEGLLERCYGGAIIGHHLRTEPLYSQKRTTFQDEKGRIGALSASLVEDGETIFVGAGTTTLEIFSNLAGKNLQIITTNLGVITEGRIPGIEVTLTGGNYREQAHSLLGPDTILSLQHYHASKCFIGTDGITIKQGLTTPNVAEALVLRTMLERTRGPKILMTDHSKFGLVASATSCMINEIDIIVTDDGLDQGYQAELGALGVEVLLA